MKVPYGLLEREDPNLRLYKPDTLSSDAKQFLVAESNGLQTYTIHLDYDYWTAGTFQR